MSAAALSPVQPKVLLASPTPEFRERMRDSLTDRSCRIQEAVGGADALVKLENGNDWQLLMLDRQLPDLNAEELTAIINRRYPGIRVVVVDSETLPCAPEPVAFAKNGEAEEVPQCLPAIEPLPGMVGRSEAMRRLYRLVRLVAYRMTTVLVTGATGTGKELVARAVHELSPRARRPFVVVNCAAIPETLLEAELFGFIRGAFTGAIQSYSGRIQAAQGGTLFLDEVGELPLGLQAKLLRFLDSKEVQRLGTVEIFRADVRVIAATNAPLRRLAGEGKFRSDLYYRLLAFPIEVPTLLERVEDIGLLAEHFLDRLGGSPDPPRLSREALHRLQAHSWGGNVRELNQVMERAAILCEGGKEILPEHLQLWLDQCSNGVRS